MDKLSDRVMALEGPDREVDQLIAIEHRSTPERRVIGVANCKPYTASLDAAMPLVPEGWTVAHIGQSDDKRWFAELREGHRTSYSRVALSALEMPNPALALCAAALKARGL